MKSESKGLLQGQPNGADRPTGGKQRDEEVRGVWTIDSEFAGALAMLDYPPRQVLLGIRNPEGASMMEGEVVISVEEPQSRG